MNMNYHLEHHTIPMVPYHALPELHEHFKPQSPPPYRNLLEVYREMIPALIKQATEDPDYHIERPIPADPTPASAAAEAPVTAEAVAVADDWVDVCAVAELDEQDVRRFEHAGQIYAIYRLTGDQFYASAGLCTHEQVDLSDGLVIDGCIECPKHNGRFELATGDPVRRPVKTALKMYPVEKRGDRLFVQLVE
jgi:Na+-transporting NADH:ubiquinone oxidoreductase subunit F